MNEESVIERNKNAKFPKEIEEYIDEAARRGAAEAINLLYAEIGRSGLRKVLLVLGAGLAALLSWLGLSGHLPK